MLVDENKYLSGQKWHYKALKGQEYTSILILKVEMIEAVEIVHLTVVGDDDSFDAPIHMPFSIAAVEKSTLSLQSENNRLPEFQEGYEYWRKHYLDGKAGIYDITVADVLEF